MKKLYLPAFLPNNCLFLVLFALSFIACQSFPKGYHLMLDGKTNEAKDIFEKTEKHSKYGPGATYYKEVINMNNGKDLPEWERIHNVFCELEHTVKNLPEQQRYKLADYKVTPARIRESRQNLETRILEHLCAFGTIADLDYLYDNFPHWMEKPSRDSVRDVIVNMTIDPNQPVYEKKCRDWARKSDTSSLQHLHEAGRPCTAYPLREDWQITYEDATGILERYDAAVLESNYAAFWGIREHIWDIFKIHHSFCDMGRFKEQHPNNLYASDCWFDNARDTLCLGLLRPLLAFHRNNPYTALDIDICNQILCLALIADDAPELDAGERKQVEDVEMMVGLQKQFICHELNYDTSELIPNVEYLAKKYPQHRVVFDLALELSNYLFTTGQMRLAKKAAETLAPLFPDEEVCLTNFDFQVGKQKWFANYAALLQRVGDSLALVKPVSAWNTPDNDEYALVSWGESDEVFFVRRYRKTGLVQVMTSKLESAGWTKPTVLQELSIANDVVPLSISADGRLMLLKSGGRLLQSYRHETRRPWSKPDPLPMAFKFGGKATFSPDASLLLLEDYSGRRTALNRPNKDIFVSKMGTDGRYGTPTSVGSKINLPNSDDGNPFIAAGGRMLVYTSDNDDGLGYADVYSVVLEKAGDWSTAGEPMNMGLQLNTVFEDNGLTFFSEYTGKGFFDRRDKCTGDIDIWGIPVVAPEVFPPNAMRLAGIVLDENKKPVTGGFMEFTTDYNLRAHSQPISAKGTYSHTAPDNSEVVRLFPETPGYYSERDTTHFLANLPKGQIIRDTFILTSFEHIRQNFKLRHSTFMNGTAHFDNPAKAFPELTRLAKIATRMGAELELTGHTDSTGAEGANHKLALDRAQSVKLFMVEKCGFDPDKIKVFAFGPTKPICPNATDEGRRCNRRVEVVFIMPVLPSTKEGVSKSESSKER